MEVLLRRPAWRVSLALVLVLALALALLAGSASTPLFDQDEAAYAGFARGMVQSGQWVLHSFPWSDMHRKPPLSLWLIASSTALFGEHWLTVRLPAALCFGASCVLLWRLGARVFGASRAALATVVLGTSLAPVFGKLALVDPVLLLCELLFALGLLWVLAGQDRRGALLAAVGLGAGLLAKGPAALLFCAVLAMVLLVVHPKRRRLLTPWPLVGLTAAFLPLLVWGLAAWQADGGKTISWMLNWYLLARAGGQVLGQTGPPGSYLLSFGVFLWPWVAFLPAGLMGLAAGLRRREELDLALLAWLIAGWLLWELLPSKLPAYALGAYPALALVIARPLLMLGSQDPSGSGLQLRLVRWGLLALAALSVLAGAVLAGAALGVSAAPLVSESFRSSVCLTALFFACSGLAFSWAWLSGRSALGLGLGLAAGPTFLALVWLLLLPALRPRLHPTWTVAQVVQAGRVESATGVGTSSTPVLLADAWRLPSLPYYLGQDGRQVQILPTDQVVAAVARPGPVIAILPQGALDEGGDLAPGTTVQHVDGWIPDKGSPTRFVVVTRRSQ